MKSLIKKLIPGFILNFYHLAMAETAALYYRYPSKKLKVVGITGTKGKTTTAEIVNAILEEAGFKTALCGTLRFKIGENSRPNLYKMTMPGRFFIQKFLSDSLKAGCDWVVMEMTSEGAKQFRHRGVFLDALVFTNLAPEHIESHGSYENYLKAKLKLGHSLGSGVKKDTTVIANIDDKEGEKFLALPASRKIPYSLNDATSVEAESSIAFRWQGQEIKSPLKGKFNIYNILAAATFARSQNIGASIVTSAISKLKEIRGRVQEINVGQKFGVFVDYAHTPDSLKALYEAFSKKNKICVLGNTGGGRDKWKRPEMAKIADQFCNEIFLTNEDPYDEDPEQIIQQMAMGVTTHTPSIILDRRKALREAFKSAGKLTDSEQIKTVVLISGKGTDPFIMGAKGSKIPWDDATVAREELEKLGQVS